MKKNTLLLLIILNVQWGNYVSADFFECNQKNCSGIIDSCMKEKTQMRTQCHGDVCGIEKIVSNLQQHLECHHRKSECQKRCLEQN